MVENVKVIWASYNPKGINRGYWDQGILEDLFKRPGLITWHHQTEITDLEENEGAVIVLNGRMHDKYLTALANDMDKLRWVLLIITGDEEAVFPWQNVRHPLLRTWVQLPRMNVHNDVSQKLPNGARPNTLEILKGVGAQPKTNDIFFAGQINHDRRNQCLEAVQSLPVDMATCIVVPTTGFGEEKVVYDSYLSIMAQSRIVLCPSGIETPDTFRLYEALEAGCLPVVDAFATRNQSYGFWKYLYDEDVPFPIVDYWDKLPALLPELLRDYPHNANKAAAWWQNQKRKLHHKLINDIKEISR